MAGLFQWRNSIPIQYFCYLPCTFTIKMIEVTKGDSREYKQCAKRVLFTVIYVCFYIVQLVGPGKGNYGNSLVEKAFTQRWFLWTLKNGIETLTETLEAKLLENGVNILRNKNSTSMSFGDGGSVEIRIGQDDKVTADHVFSSIPTKGLAALLPEQHSSLAELLRRVTAVTIGVVNIEFEGSVLRHMGFGYLYPSSESAKVLGVIFDSCTFPHADSKASPSTRITVC